MLSYAFGKRGIAILSLPLILVSLLAIATVQAYDFNPFLTAGLVVGGLPEGLNNGPAGGGGGLGLACAPALLAAPIGGTATLTVRVATAPNKDLTVNLASNNPMVAQVPATVTIPAGETSATAAVNGVLRGATFITASVDAEQARCSVYVGPRFSGNVSGLATTPLRVVIGGPDPTSAVPVRVFVRGPEPTLAVPVRVWIDPLAITQPVKVRIQP